MNKYIVMGCAAMLIAACGPGNTDQTATTTTTETTTTNAPASSAVTDTSPAPGSNEAKPADAANGSNPSPPRAAATDTFTTAAGVTTFDAKHTSDLTGDRSDDIVALHAAGARPDNMAVRLSILSAGGDTLYVDTWDTKAYFNYTPRSKFSNASADSLVLHHLREVTRREAFSKGGPPSRMRIAMPKTGGIDPDAVRYDLKESGVRAAHRLPRGSHLTPPLLAEQEKFVVPQSSIDSLVAELKTRSTFTYFAGGELTNTIAWSSVKHRFVRVFTCC